MMSPNPIIQRTPISALPNLPIAIHLPVLSIQQRLVSMAHRVLTKRVQAVESMRNRHCLRDALLEMIERSSYD